MAAEKQPKFKRVLLKLSGEALARDSEGIYNHGFIDEIANVVKKCIDCGVEIGVVVGAGNIWRGRQGVNMDRVRADHMGMLATVINSLALQDAFERAGVSTRVMTAIEMNAMAEPYIRNRAVRHLEKGRVTIFGCGLGSPYFSTDTAAVLRAAEIGADVVLLAKNIDGVYTADPKKDASATKINEITYQEILSRGLAAMDSTATSFCMDNHIPILVFGLDDPDNIFRAVMGEEIGTIVK
ncbi:MAG: UMP kinase [Ruminococcaceae bacterium]|nr:UMP kinase [Oscillospiraceae bacterium]